MRYTQDLYRMEFDDLFSIKRQNEIMMVVDAIKRFKPTKLAFEVVKSEENLLNDEYEKFLDGEMKLKIDEIHQFGFRIAAELNHINKFLLNRFTCILYCFTLKEYAFSN